jgi:hypothetical protein
MATQADIQVMQRVIDGLDRNRVSNFSYTKNAIDDDDVDGVKSYALNAENNIPDVESMELNETVRDKGFRAQTSSIPRNALNHFWGRMSYNLNKLVQLVKTLILHIKTASARNWFEYDKTAEYLHGDICYIIQTFEDERFFSVFRRKGTNPAKIQNVSPLLSGVEWEQVFSSENISLIEDFNEALSRRQYRINATGSGNLLTAPDTAGGQPGIKASSEFAPIKNPVFTGVPKVPLKNTTAVNDGTLIATEAQVSNKANWYENVNRVLNAAYADQANSAVNANHAMTAESANYRTITSAEVITAENWDCQRLATWADVYETIMLYMSNICIQGPNTAWIGQQKLIYRALIAPNIPQESQVIWTISGPAWQQGLVHEIERDLHTITLRTAPNAYGIKTIDFDITVKLWSDINMKSSMHVEICNPEWNKL